jgi:hypothetical protein
LNLLFNAGPEAYEITPPPKQIVGEGVHPHDNLRWREMLKMVMAHIDPKTPSKEISYFDLVHKRCAEDPVFFTNGFCWGDDPSEGKFEFRRKPIVLWPKQEEILLAIREGIVRGGIVVVRKGRKVLGTYLFGITGLHGWLYHDESFLIVTRHQDLLDGAGTATVFGKIKDMLRHLPKWMLPQRWSESQAKGYCTTAKLQKPKDLGGGIWVKGDAVIQGLAATENAPVGGRYMAMLVDEAGPIDDEHPGRVQEMVGRTLDTVRCVYLPSTPRKRTTYHSELMRADEDEFAAFEGRPIFRFDLNWTQDPKKNTPTFTIPYRPHIYNTLREFYGTLLKLHEIETHGDTETPDYKRLRSKCVDIDPETDAGEWERPFSTWYLKECLSRSKSDSDARLIRTEVDGLEEEDELYLFSPSALKAQPIREPLEYGDFLDISDNHPLLDYTNKIGRIQVWGQPATEHEDPRYYVITADASGGVGLDYSVAMVWDVTDFPIRQVALLRDDRVGPIRLGEYVWALWKWYGTHGKPYVCPESNKEGLLTIAKMIEMGIDLSCIYKHGRSSGRDGEIGEYGFYSHGDSRIALLAAFQELFEQPDRKIVIHSERTRYELGNIPSDKDKRYKPETGHDDCVIGAALLRPALLGYNKQLFGREMFDVVGWKLAEREAYEVERRAERRIREMTDKRGRHKRIPIYRTKAVA